MRIKIAPSEIEQFLDEYEHLPEKVEPPVVSLISEEAGPVIEGWIGFLCDMAFERLEEENSKRRLERVHLVPYPTSKHFAEAIEMADKAMWDVESFLAELDEENSIDAIFLKRAKG